jgi:hypothetical protein
MVVNDGFSPGLTPRITTDDDVDLLAIVQPQL